jgi:hypothetical protein
MYVENTHGLFWCADPAKIDHTVKGGFIPVDKVAY